MKMATFVKKCLVKCCTNDSNKTPKKYFITVPIHEEERRKKWFNRLGLPVAFGKCYVCEDHFNLPEDSQNWMYFKTVGSCLLLKKDVVPHKNLRSNSTPTPPQRSLPEEPPKNNMVEVNLQKFKEENLENLRQLEQARKELNLQEVNLEKLKEENLENLRKLEEARTKLPLRAKKKKKRKKKIVKKKTEIEPPKSPTPPPEPPQPTFQTIAYLPTGLYNINAMPSISAPLLPYNYIQPDTYVNLCGQVLPPFIIQNEDQETLGTQTCINAIPSGSSLLGPTNGPLLGTSAPITAPLLGSTNAPLLGSISAPLPGSTSAPLLDHNYLERRTYVNVCGQQLVSPSIVENKYQETLETQTCIKKDPEMGIENNGLCYPEVQIKEEIKDELIIKEEPIEPANFEFVNMAPEVENVFYNEDS